MAALDADSAWPYPACMATLVLEHCETVGADRLGDTLREYGHRLDVIKVHRGDALPPDLENVDAIVCCGGVQNLGDAPEWMEPEQELLRQANAMALPVVGICLGHQLLASALGGEIGKVEKGIQVGWEEVTLNHLGREDPLFAGIAWKSMQPHWNSYGITKLPPDARTLASSAKNPVECWALGLRTYGFAFHPEINADTFAKWAEEDPEGLEAAGISVEDLLRQTEMMYPTYERLTRRLFEAITLVLMPVDRRYGVAKEIHH